MVGHEDINASSCMGEEGIVDFEINRNPTGRPKSYQLGFFIEIQKIISSP